MATTDTNIIVGAATLEWGAYVTAAGADPTMTDAGHTNGPVKLTIDKEIVEIGSERANAPVLYIPVGMKPAIVIPAMEMTHAFMAMMLSQASGNVSGTPPNTTMLVGDMTEAYYRVKITARSPGANSLAVWTFYKCAPGPVGEFAFAKAAPQSPDVTFNVVRDASISAANKYFKVIYS